MLAEKFNRHFDQKATEFLIPLGFKKMGVSYYLVEGENIFVFNKRTFRGSFTGFAFCYSHTFFKEFIYEKGKLKIERYSTFPLSINCLYIEILDTNDGIVWDQPYEFNGGRRPLKFFDLSTEVFDLQIFSKKKVKLPTINEAYIENSVLLAKNFGIKYLRQLRPEITLKILQKDPDTYYYLNYINQLKEHLGMSLENN